MDLHPNLVDFFRSAAYAIAGDYQAGYIEGSSTHAALWKGSSTSAVDLHSYLPPEFTGSIAYGVDLDGNVVGLAAGPGGAHAVMWTTVPEPGSVLTVFIGLGCALLRRRTVET